MTWAEHHAESERLAIEAQLALKARNSLQAINLYRQAAEAERRALDQIDVSKVRTRGVTAVSAVALWFKAGEYEYAEQLAHLMLADTHCLILRVETLGISFKQSGRKVPRRRLVSLLYLVK